MYNFNLCWNTYYIFTYNINSSKRVKLSIACQSIEYNYCMTRNLREGKTQRPSTVVSYSGRPWDATARNRLSGSVRPLDSVHRTSHHTPHKAEPLVWSGLLQLHDFELSDLAVYILYWFYIACNTSFQSHYLLLVMYSLLQEPPL